MNRENLMMLATVVCLLGIIFVFKELNKAKEEINSFRTFSEQVTQYINTPILEEEEEKKEEEESAPKLEKIEEKKEE
jgi:hypothetical protein